MWVEEKNKTDWCNPIYSSTKGSDSNKKKHAKYKTQKHTKKQQHMHSGYPMYLGI